MDAIARVAFGLEVNSLKDPNNDFVVQANKLQDSSNQLLIFLCKVKIQRSTSTVFA